MFTRHAIPSLLACALLAPWIPAQGPRSSVTPERAPGWHNPNWPAIQDPVLSETSGADVRVPASDQVQPPSEQVNVVGQIVRTGAQGRRSLRGSTITKVESPQKDLQNATRDMEQAAIANDTAAMTAAANEMRDILLGTTSGRIYDGFALLNFNRGAFADGHVAGEYKLKTLTDSGLTVEGLDGQPRKVWEVTVNVLWYDRQFDSDTHLIRVPVAAHPFDVVQVHYRIYSLVREDFSPTSFLNDFEYPGSQQLPFLGFDSVWIGVFSDELTEITVQHPPLGLLAGITLWGRRETPSALLSLKLVREIVNAHSGLVELDPEGLSRVKRNRKLTLDAIGEAAPEKKMLTVADAVLAGATPAQVQAMLNNPNQGPAGVWQDWVDLEEDHRQLPPEAWDLLALEGIPQGSFGPYGLVTVFMNNEMYGDGPAGTALVPFEQGARLNVKVINLDGQTHYLQVHDYGRRLHNGFDQCDTAPGGGNSVEIMSYKPMFGAPKDAELQWRAGWGFRPHLDVIVQQNVYENWDRGLLEGYTDGFGRSRSGWQYSPGLRGGDFVFDPPLTEIGTENAPSPLPLMEGGLQGLVIGQLTPGYGIAKLCSHASHPPGQPCTEDLARLNPYGALNVDTDLDGTNDELWFPAYLRNPNPAGGDLIPATPEWKPFLWINPVNGSLLADPADPGQGYWIDRTFVHGAPVPAGGSMTAEIEAPRGHPQGVLLTDGLFEDNALFLLRPDVP